MIEYSEKAAQSRNELIHLGRSGSDDVAQAVGLFVELFEQNPRFLQQQEFGALVAVLNKGELAPDDRARLKDVCLRGLTVLEWQNYEDGFKFLARKVLEVSNPVCNAMDQNSILNTTFR